MALDECTPGDADRKYAEKSLKLTRQWLARCIRHFDETEPLYGYSQTFFPIVQGCTYKDLREKAAEDAMLMTNGLGASLGLFAAQAVIDHFVNVHPIAADAAGRMTGWSDAWFVFAGYALVVALLFMILFRYKHTEGKA